MVLNLFFYSFISFHGTYFSQRKVQTCLRSMEQARGKKEQWAIDAVFGNGDLLKNFKDCFTKETFIFCKAAVRFARNNEMDIIPVAVRANVDLLAYRQASWYDLKLKVCDIELPAHLDPTLDLYSNQHLCDLLLEGPDRDAKFQADVNRLRDINIMTQMLEAHAADLRRLKIHMSLDVELSDDVEQAWRYKYINNFLKALAKCTGIKSLTIVQSDHVEKNATVKSVQLALFKIIKTMQLESLDFNGNMTIHAGLNVLSLPDYIPPSLRKLIVRDGAEPRMFKWYDDDGISLDFKRTMVGCYNDVLKSIYLPSSFWCLSTQKFCDFFPSLNANHITHIGFSDAFQLMKAPTTRTAGHGKLSAPCRMLHVLLVTLIYDMVIDLRGGDDVERAARIEWAMVNPVTSGTNGLREPNQRSDGEGYTTITMRKINGATLQVLI